MLNHVEGAPEGRRYGFFEIFGMMTAVAIDSDYNQLTVRELGSYLVPALDAGQYKVYLNNLGRPSAFVTWAFVDDECHQILSESGINPPPNRWRAGPNLWFMDIVAPFGDARTIVRDLQRNHFPDLRAHSIKRNADGSIKRVKVWKNLLATRPSL